MSETDPLYEQLAAIQHDIWAHWMRYLLESKTFPVTTEPTGRGMREADVQHWLRQVGTPYAELSEAEKASDREQVDRFWPLVADVKATADSGTILAAWRDVCRLVDDTGFLSPASVVDRVAMLTEQKPALIETVSPDEATALPGGTRLVPCTPDGVPLVGHHIRRVEGGVVKMPVPAGHEWLRFLVCRPAAASGSARDPESNR